MLAREFLEIILQDGEGVAHRQGLLFPLKLQQKALLQILGGDASWLKFLNYLQDVRQLVAVGVDVLLKQQVVADGWKWSFEVAVFVDVADDVFGDLHVGFVQFGQAQLLQQVVVQRFAHRERYVFFLFVRGMVVVVETVVWNVVFGEIITQGKVFLRGVAAFVVDILHIIVRERIFYSFLQCGIIFQLLFDALFQLQKREFRELDDLHLERR